MSLGFEIKNGKTTLLAELKSRIDPRLNCQQLDDNCSARPEGSKVLRRYRKHYREIAEKIGVKLA